jgi:hypothetical protein
VADKDIEIRVLTHRETGLLMAIAEDDLPGFFVHAHSDEEMGRKLPRALESFLRATTGDDVKVELHEKKLPPGYGPPTFTAHTHVAEAA